MADLISRAAAIEEIARRDTTNGTVKVYSGREINEVLNGLPAVDAVPVLHGWWIEYPLCLGYVGAYSEDHIVCSNCKTVWSIIDNDTERFEHCPNCGAKMDGRDDCAAD